MKTRVLSATDTPCSAEAFSEAASALRAGSLVVFPTETVYGVGASAARAEAVELLGRLKERPDDKPFTLHLPDPELAARYAGPLPLVARRLIRKAWPGPVMLVVPDQRASRDATLGLVETSVYWHGTVGLRCPDHDVGRAVLREAGVPVVATSANLPGRPPPRSAEEALRELGGRVSVVVDAGPTAFARPSTVVRVRSDGRLEVLREGAVAAHRVRRMAVTRVLVVCSGNMCRSPMAEGLAKKMAAERLGCEVVELGEHGLEIASAGTGAGMGGPASRHAVEAMRELGVDLRYHRTRGLTVDLVRGSDYIWVMTRGHKRSVSELAPEAAERVALLGAAGEEIGDPIGGDLEAYRACAERIERAVAEWIPEIVE